MAKKWDLLFKCVILGPGAAGKSSIFLRFTDTALPSIMNATIGFDFGIKYVELDGKRIKLQLWDTAGQDRFFNMYKSYIEDADGAIVIYDITDEDNFIEAETRIQQVKKHSRKNAVMIIVGNKCDLEESRQVSRESGEKLAAKYECKFFETSAKSNTNVSNVLYTLAKDIKTKFEREQQDDQIPEEIQQDPYALDMYRRALTAGREHDRSVRVNIVGNYKQGKTCLMRRLLGQTVDTTVESTNGIDIERYICEISMDGKLTYKKANDLDRSDILQRLVAVAIASERDKPESEEEHVSNSDIYEPVPAVQMMETENETTKQSEVLNEDHAMDEDSRAMDEIQTDENKTAMLSLEEKNTFAKELKMSSDSKKTTQISFDIWDFGGQYIFYATHTIFHSKRAIYLLVFDLSLELDKIIIDEEFHTDSSDRNMEYFLHFWMNSIHSFVGSMDGFEPTVILVGTHKDEVKGDEDAKRKYIQKYFDDIRQLFDGTKLLNHIHPDDFAVDNSTTKDASVASLRETIVKVGSEQTQSLEIPAKWIQLERSLYERKHLKVISLKFVLAIDSVNEFSLGDLEQVKLFLRYHHGKGMFVYFDEDPISEYIILDPQYLIDAFKSIITCKRFCTNDPNIRPLWKVLFSEGRLEKRLIDKQWGKPEDTFKMYIENRDILLAFLIKHHIISEATTFDETTRESTGLGWYVVPSLLRDNSTKMEMQEFLQGKKQTKVCLVIQFHNSPIVPTIYHRLMAATIGNWPIAQAGKRTLIYKDRCIVRLSFEHVGILEMRLDSIELNVVSLCPAVDVDGKEADMFRRFSEAVITNEFRKLRGKSDDSKKPFTLRYRCNHESHGAEGCTSTIEYEKLVDRKKVPCPDLMTHGIDAVIANSEWYRDNREALIVPDIPLDDKLLSRISQYIGNNWQLLGFELGLTKVQIEHITADHPYSTAMKIYYMLKAWCLKEVDVPVLGNLVKAMQQCSGVTMDWDNIRNIVDELK